MKTISLWKVLKPKTTIQVMKGAYGTSEWGYESAIVKHKDQEIHRTGLFTGGADGEARLWCDQNGYRY